MTCLDPIDAVVLADYWLGMMAESEEESVEVHLLTCDRCGERLREIIAMGEGLRHLARQGSLRMIVSDTFLRRAAEEGLRVREYAPPAGGSVACTVTAEDDVLIGRLAVNLRDAGRVDLSICDERGNEQSRLRDIPFDTGASSVAYQESITIAKALPNSRMIARLITVDAAGSERLLGEYTFNHTRSLPGPV